MVTASLRPTNMRGAAAARKVLGLGSALLPEYHPVAREGNSNRIVDRGSCSRSGTCPNCCKDVSSSACEVGVCGGKDSRWNDAAERAEDGGRMSAARSEGVAGEAEKLFLPSAEVMKAPKEEEATIETEEAGIHESTLAKLKRKIRLRLLAEEAKNSQLVAAKAEAQELVGIGKQLESRAAAAADGGPSSSRVRVEHGNLSAQNQQQQNHHHQQQQQQHACGPPKKKGLKVRIENGRTIVDLSSDDDEDVSDPSRFQKQNTQHSQRASQAPGEAASVLRPKEEGQDYHALLERLLGPLLAKAATVAVNQITNKRPAAQKRKRTAGGRSGSSKTTAKNTKVVEPRLSAEDSLHRYRNSVSAAAAANRKRGGAISNYNMADKNPTKRGRPKGAANTATKKESRPAKEKGELLRISDTAAAVSYEQDREYNILRNKVFLQRLSLSTALESFKANQQTTQPEPRAAAPLSPKLEHSDADWEEDGELDIRNSCNDPHTEAHRVESQRSQITSASALSGSSSAFQELEKSPTTDDDLYEPEEEFEEEDDDDNSSNSSEPPSIRMRGRVKPLQKGKEKAQARGRRKTAKASTKAHSNQECNPDLISILAELLASKTADSLSPTLLQRLENATSNGGKSNETGHRGRQTASKKKPAEERQKLKRKAENTSQRQRSSSPTTSRSPGAGKKPRKDTWLTTIPFETPKTEYELQRDEAIQNRKDELDKLGAVAELLDQLKPQGPRQVRAYHKRWSMEPNPEFNRQTRLKDRLSTKSETGSLVKEEIVEIADVDPAKAKPTSSFADSLVAKFSNWATLRKDRSPAAASSREWDLNEPSTSTGSRVVSFQPPQVEREQLLDPYLTRIYTMDVGIIRGQCSGLLAAGGSKGRMAVFSLRGSEAWGTTKSGRFSDDDDAEGTSKAPLLTWSVDSSWISQVIFLPSQFKEKEMLLLSSSNDGRVVLWDVNQVRMQKGTRELSQEGMPRVVCHTTTLHSGSIFGMHEMDGRMATASEDGLGISAIRETMIFMEKCITGHHTDVIRHVRFRDKNVLADCGADMGMGILDLRCPEPCTLKLSTAHKTAMSMVEWSPASESVLLSASLDPQMYLHDIRNPRKSLFWHTLDGHVHPRRLKCYSVYRPSFVDGGQAVVSPGEGTHQLSLYAVDTGSVIGKVHLGYDSTILHWSELVPSSEGGLWAGGGSNAISQCKPVWRLPSITGQLDGDFDLQPSSQFSDPGTSVAADAPNPLVDLSDALN